ncbi:hypothetical protein, partial [Nostocoides jenkinsii]|uniref:hypothetical protein n=1 Tax=Nostocoides jenkinsii TaxID=330834 RepID=UPI001F402972
MRPTPFVPGASYDDPHLPVAARGSRAHYAREHHARADPGSRTGANPYTNARANPGAADVLGVRR